MKHLMQPQTAILRKAHSTDPLSSPSLSSAKPRPYRKAKSAKENVPPFDPNSMAYDSKQSPATAVKLKSQLPLRPPSLNPLNRKLIMETVPENSVPGASDSDSNSSSFSESESERDKASSPANMSKGYLLDTLLWLYVRYGFHIGHGGMSVFSRVSTGIGKVKSSVRGDLGPACNSAGMIDRYILGLDHLYMKPIYRNLKECNIFAKGQVSESSPPWCHAPFDPEGILSSLTATATCIIGLQYGRILAHLQDHKGRLNNWSLFSISSVILGLFLAFIGMHLNG
ncbi:isoform 2 of heparan-alpha-glucosaminide n-acetyltransferase [Fagus crenata]